MKIRLFLIVFATIPLLLNAQQECTIQGHIKGLTNGTIVSLSRENGRVMERFVSDTVQSETFSFKVKTIKQQAERIMLMGESDGFPNNWLDIYIAPDQVIKITGKDKLLRTWEVESDVPEQKYQNIFIDATRCYLDPEQELQIIATNIWREIQKKDIDENEEKQLSDSIHHIIYPKQDSLEYLIIAEEIKVMQKMPVNDVWLDKFDVISSFVFNEKEFPYTKEARALYQKLTPEQRETEKGKQIMAQLYPPKTVAVGDNFADADLYDLEGKLHHLADYKGKYMLLDFWSYGCGPCCNAIPEMKEMAETWKAKLVIISISTDSKSVWKKASEAKKLTGVVNVNDLKGTIGICALYGVQGIPYYVIISPEGKLIHTWFGYGKGLIQKKLNEWVK